MGDAPVGLLGLSRGLPQPVEFKPDRRRGAQWASSEHRPPVARNREQRRPPCQLLQLRLPSQPDPTAERSRRAPFAPSASSSRTTPSAICAAASQATRWPEKETVGDDSQGVPLDLMQDLARYWASEYDWRSCEEKLNALPQLRDRDRRSRHPLHPRSLPARGRVAAHRDPRLARLDHRAAEDHRPAHQPDRARSECVRCLPSRDPVAAGIRLLGQADGGPGGIPPAPHGPGRC